MVTDTLELEYDYYLSLANLYDTTDLDVSWDWKNQHNNNEMPSSPSNRIGAIAESDFITECLKRNFEPHPPVTAMPWDFIVTCPRGILKVQIKTTARESRDKSYNIANTVRSSIYNNSNYRRIFNNFWFCQKLINFIA